ncbi:BMP family lipoprotein [Nakamurella aerolata]|uniref:BMP family ABC transporter substrate-binding protein n=1 Tax=Nakamurella aerolata TaxID=1656892 RepID=A0A849AGJ8_9ACTN|nr:BMP family ABC transporter substrate-binding protein [Nakamurella aerolata]NNG35962.1 BMP family ABC transporter substrate-binding protein [Nakamurella aerolata]
MTVGDLRRVSIKFGSGKSLRTAAIAGTAVLALTLSACGSKGGDSNTSAGAGTTGQTTAEQTGGGAAGSGAAGSGAAGSGAAGAGGQSSAGGAAGSGAAGSGVAGSGAAGSGAQGSAAAGGEQTAPSGPVTVPADFKACMVTDTGGIDDKSFNASAWAGLQEVTGGKDSQYVASKSESDYQTNINSLVTGSCSLVFTVGGLMADATMAAAKTHPKQNFVGIDFAGNGSNIKGLEFDSSQAGMLAGYLAAGYSKTGVVATYGGLKIDPVTIYMDGFVEGVQKYNADNGKNVKVLGWDEAKQDGSIAGSFTDQNKGKQLASNFINQQADVLFPVAGGTGLGSAAAAQAAGDTAVIWVDADGYTSAPQYKSVFLATAEKNITGAVKVAIEQAAGGKFDPSNYLGTLANGGVGLSSFHDFEDKVPAELKTQLQTLEQDLASGKVTTNSPAAKKLTK